MAQQERESFSQLAAEASAAGTTAGTAAVTANGTPSCITPVGSVGAMPAPIAGLPAALSSLNLGASALVTRVSSTEFTGGHACQGLSAARWRALCVWRGGFYARPCCTGLSNAPGHIRTLSAPALFCCLLFMPHTVLLLRHIMLCCAVPMQA
jgi:hypothetical protein